ncbi:MAG: phosphatase PAP2 family protein [Bacteroidota bacterium]
MNSRLLISSLIIGVLIVNSLRLSAQDTANANTKLNGKYIASYFTDEVAVLKSPMRWNTKQWKTAGGVLCAAGLLYTQDKVIKTFFQSNRHTTLDNIANYGLEPFGRGLYSLPLLGVLYLTSEVTSSPKLRQTSLEGVKAFVVSGFTVQLFKNLLHRPRPYQYEEGDVQLFDGPFGDNGYNSMPSGHSITAFSIAAVFASEYKNTVWVPVVAYSIASGVALSRIYQNKHWASDVLMGSALGWAIGKLISNNSLMKTYKK